MHAQPCCFLNEVNGKLALSSPVCMLTITACDSHFFTLYTAYMYLPYPGLSHEAGPPGNPEQKTQYSLSTKK